MDGLLHHFVNDKIFDADQCQIAKMQLNGHRTVLVL